MGYTEDDLLKLREVSVKLTPADLKAFLLAEFGNNVELEGFEILSGASKGDNYLSCVRRIVVKGKSLGKILTLHLIVKCLPASIGRRKTFRSTDFFQNEVAFYNHVVPALMAFQEEQKPKHPFTEFPRCFFALADGENDIVVLEDMSFKNYITMNRQDGLTFEQCTYILNVLGRFHALSFAMKDKVPDAFKKAASNLQETYYKPETKAWYIDQLHLFTDIALDAVSKELSDKIYEEKFRQFTDHSCYEKMIELVKPKEPYSVISHGDTWAPNFLLCYNDEGNQKVQGLCMIDYQLARYASPILDVSFFLYSCASKDVMCRQFDDILKSYYASLSSFISDLGSSSESLFPFKVFQREVATYFPFGLGMSLESVPLATLDENETPDVESMEGDDEIPLTQIWSLKPIKSKEGRMRLAANVKHAVDNGFL